MKAADKRTEAFTRTELVVVLAIIVTLLLLFIPRNDGGQRKAERISCVNSLKQIGIAYRVWANDNGGKFPASVPQTNGGWREIANSPNAGAFVWTNYLAMANELGRSTKLLICPADERNFATDFAAIANTNISYFIGPGASDKYPQAILGGDRNLGPGTTPHDDYGFSPPDGRGNDATITGPVCWSLKMHSERNSAGAGNILLGDGSVQAASGNLNLNWMKPAMEVNTNIPGAPGSVGGIRLIFP